jgi:cell envelope opacity-associated protein A
MKKGKPSADLKTRVEAAANTAKELGEHGIDLEPTKEDKDAAARLSVAYADDPEDVSKKVTEKKMSTLTPASLILTDNILKEFGRSVVESSVQIRHLVTNKLIEETENPDPRVRIRALELLGKISDVGLFAEKSEVTITHQSTDDLRERLRSKLTKLVNPVEDAAVIDGEPIDVDKELGLDEEKGE